MDEDRKLNACVGIHNQRRTKRNVNQRLNLTSRIKFKNYIEVVS